MSRKIKIIFEKDKAVSKEAAKLIMNVSTNILNYLSKYYSLKLEKIIVHLTDDPLKAIMSVKKKLTKGNIEEKNMKEWVYESTGCFAFFPSKSEASIFIKAKDFSHLKSETALAGVIAHELLHVSHGIKGIDEFVVSSTTKQWPNLLMTMRNIEQNPCCQFDRKEIVEALTKVLMTAAFVLKDIIVDTQLLEIGLKEEVYNNYVYTFQTDDDEEIPDKASTVELEQMMISDIAQGKLQRFSQFFEVELGLISCWLPLQNFKYSNESNHILKIINSNVAIPEKIRRNVREAGISIKKLGLNPDKKTIQAAYAAILAEYYDALRHYIELKENG